MKILNFITAAILMIALIASCCEAKKKPGKIVEKIKSTDLRGRPTFYLMFDDGELIEVNTKVYASAYEGQVMTATACDLYYNKFK